MARVWLWPERRIQILEAETSWLGRGKFDGPAPDIQKPLSPEIIDAVVKKYHYYLIGFDLPEDMALLSGVLYLGATNMPVLVRIAGFSLT